MTLTSSAEYVALVAAWFVAMAATGWRASAFHVVLIAQSFVALGAIRLGATGQASAHAVGVYVAGFCALTIGYAYVRANTALGRLALTSVRRPVAPAAPTSNEAARRGAWIVFLVFLILTVYHFAIVGLPILSSNVEIARWDFTQSGLFGLPGRAYLYGLPIALIFAVATARRDVRLVRSAFVALVLSRVAGGFKGEMLEAVVLVYILHVTVSGSISLARVARRYALPVAGALVFAAGVSQFYASARSASAQSPASELATRMTTAAARTPLTAIEYRDSGVLITPRITFIHDVINYVRSITGTPNTPPLFNSMLSARIYGRDPLQRSNAPGSFVVPVASGALAVLYYNFGAGAYLAMFAIGVIFGLAESHARRTRSSLALSGLSVFMFALYQFLMKEDFASLLVNWSVMTSFALLIYAFGARQTHSVSRTRFEPVPYSSEL